MIDLEIVTNLVIGLAAASATLLAARAASASPYRRMSQALDIHERLPEPLRTAWAESELTALYKSEGTDSRDAGVGAALVSVGSAAAFVAGKTGPGWMALLGCVLIAQGLFWLWLWYRKFVGARTRRESALIQTSPPALQEGAESLEPNEPEADVDSQRPARVT